MHILSVYIIQIGANQQLYGWVCWWWARGLQAYWCWCEISQSWAWQLTLNKRLFVSYYKFHCQKLQCQELN